MAPVTATVEVAPMVVDDRVHARRWAILAVLCLSLLVTGIDGTIVNVALPTLVRELNASSSDLQWIVDAYTIVFASLLLMAGNTGDRRGRKKTLIGGLAVFGIGSAIASQVGSAEALIGMRAVQGFGAAFLMPATLSILTNVFRDATERRRAIALWSGVAGLGVAIGPLTGGWLLEHFWWGSIFLVNVPVVVVAIVAAVVLVPDSKDPTAPPLDLGGVLFSIVGLFGLLYGIIEGPAQGWTDPTVIGAFVIAGVFLTSLVLWELHTPYPLLEMKFFKNPRFSAASIAITLVFFAMFGSLFFLSQYLQFVLGYDAFEAGLALLPVAVSLMIAAPVSARLVAWVGTKIVVAAGLVVVAAGMVLMSFASVDSGYGLIAGVLVTIGVGMGLAMAPATDSIMGSLPPERAGVGSAMNDTTREIGGALGVAVLGSITAASYAAEIVGSSGYAALKKAAPQLAGAVSNSVGSAAVAATKLPAAAAQQVLAASRTAFVSALDTTVIVGAVVALAGAVIAAVFLPARARSIESRPEEVQDLARSAAQKLAPASRRSVLHATLSILAEGGLSSLSVNGIAARSGVATATIEHLWSSKLDMVVQAFDSVFARGTVPDTGSFRTDCDIYLTNFAGTLSRGDAAPVIAALVGEAGRDPRVAAALRARLIEPRRAAVREMIQRGVDRGELDGVTDTDLIADVLAGPLFHRLLITGEPISTETGHELATLVADHVGAPHQP
jgi:EmrB/QacA subfamily drug resistance transporter